MKYLGLFKSTALICVFLATQSQANEVQNANSHIGGGHIKLSQTPTKPTQQSQYTLYTQSAQKTLSTQSTQTANSTQSTFKTTKDLESTHNITSDLATAHLHNLQLADSMSLQGRGISHNEAIQDSSAESTTANQTKNTDSSDDEVEYEFETINISGQQLSNDEKPFTQAGAVSSRVSIGETTQSIDSVIRSIPGGFTQIDQSQAGVSINIRGMTGPGRVNTMIDGVTQTNFGTSTDASYHAQTGTSSFNTTINQDFLVGFDMERGTFSGANGSNALMGSANLRTIGIDDIISGKNQVGVLSRVGFGSNGIGPSFMVASAGRLKLKNEDSHIGFMLAYSAIYHYSIIMRILSIT